MSGEKPLNNPFVNLDKKRFRPSPGKKGNRDTIGLRQQEAAVPAEIASEDELFLDAMRAVAPLGTSGRSEKGGNAVPNSENQGFAVSLDMSSLRNMSKSASRRKSRPDDFPAMPSKAPATGSGDRVGRRLEHMPKSRTDLEGEHSTEEDLRFFAAAVRDVTPLPGKGREVPPEPQPADPPPTETGNPLQDFMEGKLVFALASTDEYVEGHVVGLDLMIVGKLQAGQFSPEAHLDLHGLNALQAFQTLVGFIKGAYLKGQRTVLVVPGRGRNSPSGVGILREKIQNWFTQEPFRRVVLAFCTAKPTDGGAGALYVLLRKFRKDRGKVYWDRRPADPDLV